MFSSSLAAATWAMRPGLVSGCYPERGDRETNWFDRSFSALQGRVSNLSIDRQAPLHRIAAAIGSVGEVLTDFDTAHLDALLMELRRRFRSQGLSQSLCIRAFALIREMAERTIHLRHYDSQLMAGWVMLRGQLAEMETGEGKTLAATLAAATAALAGIPTHVITVNEYLVERDAKSMGPLYRALGLTVGHVTQAMASQHRQAAYACDITYCTNKQVAFDYLRDRLLLGNSRSPMRLQLESAYDDNNRLDRQLFGRCARQGDPGSHQSILSLEDQLIQENCHPALVRFLRRLVARGGLFQRTLTLYTIRYAQRKTERRHRKARRDLLKHERQTGRLLAFSGHME